MYLIMKKLRILGLFISFIFSKLSAQLLPQYNCIWLYTNEIDCAFTVEVGFSMDTAGNNNISHFMNHQEPAYLRNWVPGGWKRPNADTMEFNCAFCGLSDSILDVFFNSTSNPLDPFYYFEAITEFSPLSVQRAYDSKQLDKLKTKSQNQIINLPDVFGCVRNIAPTNCVINNYSAPRIDWENKKVDFLGAYKPQYPPCPPPKP